MTIVAIVAIVAAMPLRVDTETKAKAIPLPLDRPATREPFHDPVAERLQPAAANPRGASRSTLRP